MANISNVINVALLPEGAAVARDNMNVCAVLTSQQSGPLSSANRYGLYKDPASVAADFGSDSDMYAHAVAFFGTTPNPINAGGVLVAGYWRGAEETTDASAAVLTGAQLVPATVVAAAQAISDGTLDISYLGSTVNVTALDMREITSLADIATLLDNEVSGITGATVSVSSDNQIVVTNDTTGASSLITAASDPGTGTFVGTLLGLAAGTGAVAVQGEASAVLSVETQLAAATALKALVNFKGATFIDADTDPNRILMAAWAQANDVLMYEVFSASTNLDVDITNPVWAIKLASSTNYRMLYSAAGNRKLATSYMARVHVVNFGGERTALTMHLKTLSVTAEEYTQTVVSAAKAVGLDIYTTIKDVAKALTSGAHGYVDDRYNLLAFVDAVQTDMFNLLAATATKIPQTRRGVNQLIDQGEKTTREFVRAGVFAPGTWSSPDYFGDYDTFTRQIEQNGFYWLAGSLADQSTASRVARESPVLQAAVKNAGAIHSADIIINFNA
jgi:hypothetical protein